MTVIVIINLLKTSVQKIVSCRWPVCKKGSAEFLLLSSPNSLVSKFLLVAALAVALARGGLALQTVAPWKTHPYELFYELRRDEILVNYSYVYFILTFINYRKKCYQHNNFLPTITRTYKHTMPTRYYRHLPVIGNKFHVKWCIFEKICKTD